MTTGVFLLSPAGMFADANAQAVQSNGTLTANGSVVLSGFGNQECHLVVNVTVAPTGVLPTLQFFLQEVDPGDLTTLIGAPIPGSVLTAVGTNVVTLPTSATSAVQISWVVTGAGASFTGVFATFVSKLTSPKVEGLGTPGTPTGGVVSIQGVLGGQPLPVSGTVMATNPSVDVDGGPAPAYSTQIGGSDGANLQAARIHDLDTGVGSEYDLGVSIRLPSAGGSVAGGTATDPLRVDPTGTTTQPISATALPLPTGAATEATLATRVSDATILARLNTLGQKAMAASAPVVIASDQSAVPIAGSTGAGSQEARVHDLDTGVGTEYDLGVSLRLSAPGGSVEGGTAAHPVRVDPTGTTTQPISATALPLPTGAATEATLATRVSDATIIARLGTLGQKTMAGSAPVVIASDQSRVPVSTEVQADYDTGIGTQDLSLIGLGLPSAGGAVAGGTSTNPIRVDPTGTTTQPISATVLPLPTGAATEATLLTRVANATILARLNTLGQKVMAASAPVVIASDQSAVAISSTQLPAALVGGRLDINLGSWLGSVGPTTGQKTMANSLPVVIASDQTPIPVSGTVSATNPSVSANAAPIPGSSTQIGGSDGVNLEAARVHDLDTGVGVEYDLGVSIRLPSVGGSVAGGTGTNPLRTDPTGTTTQPISAVALPLPTGAATEATLATRVSDATIITRLGTLGQKLMAGSAPVVIASDQTTIPISGTVTATNPSVGAINSAFPGSATQIGASDGVNLRVPRVFDADTGGGLEFVIGTILRKSASGGSVEAGTATDPLRVDPTGTTTQPISSTQLPAALVAGRLETDVGAWLGSTAPTVGQKTMANSIPVVVASNQSAIPVSDGGGSLTIDTTQLPAALVGGRLDINTGSWLGSTAPTVGQKTMANSIPVVISSDQTAIPVSGSFGGSSVGPTNTAVPSDATQVGGSDGTKLQALRVFDVDTGAGTQYVAGVSLRKGASGGSVEAGTSTDPLRVDPTGTTTQPISAVSLPLPTGAATEATLATRLADATFTARINTLGQKTMANSTPVVLSSDQSAIPITDNGGSLTIDTPQLPAALVGGRLDINVGSWLGSTAPTVGQKTSANSLPVVVASDQSAIPVSGTVTANIGTTGGLALDATLTGGTQKAIVRGGAKGATVAADVTSTAEGADHQALDVQIYSGGVAKDPTQIRALTNADVISTEVTKWIGSTAPTVGQKAMASSLPVVVSSDQSTIPVSDGGGSLTIDTTQLPAALVGGRLDINVGAWLGSTAPTVGQKTMANSIPVVISSDQTAIPITGSITATNPSVGSNNAAIPTSSTQIGGSDGTNLQAARIFDADSGVGTQYVLGTILRKSASGGSVEAGTATDPLRVDPTGTTTQPVSGTVTANIGTTGGLALDATLTGGTAKAIVRGGAKGATVAADVTSTAEGADHQSLDVQIYHGGVAKDPTQIRALTNADVISTEITKWIGSTAPTVGQKTMTNSIPVVIASDQSPVPISGSITATNPSVGPTNSAVPTDATQIGGTDGTNLQTLRVFDVDTGVGTQFVAGVSLRKAASGGSVEAGTSSDPLRIDPTGTTTQPVSDGGGSLTIDTPQLPAALVGGRLDINVGAWLGSTVPTVGQKTSANSIPVVIASDQSAVAVSGTVTANIGTTGGLALDATLTGGTQRTRVTDGTNDAAVKAASTAAVATDPALVVAISPNNSVTVSTADTTATGTLGALNAAVTVALKGESGAGFQLDAGTLIGTIVPEVSLDGGTTWVSGFFTDPSTGSKSTSIVFAANNTATTRSFIGPAGASHARVRVSAYTSGSTTITVKATQVKDPSLLSEGATGALVPTVAVQVAGSDGTNLRAIRTAADGTVRIDPTGTTTQPISAVSLPLPTGASTAANQTTLGSQTTKINDGTNTAAVKAASTAAIATDQALVVAVSPNNTVAVTGTVTSNIGTTGGLALDATLTGGTAKAIVRGGTKGATTPADVTSTAEGADHQALDVQIYHGGVAKDPTQIRALTNADVVSSEITKWIGSTAPTVGQKTSANSLPVVIASDQSAIPVTGTFDNGSVGATGAAAPSEATQVGGTDGTNLQAVRVFDADSGAGTQYVLGAILRKSASGGSVEAGTSSDPLRVDPTGTTTQPVSDGGGSLTIDTTQLPAALVGGRLDINVGAWLGSTAPTVGQKTSANSIPTVIASDQSAIPVSGTVTANIGTTGGLALDVTLTGGTTKAIVRGGTKGATTPADVTSTAEGADHQALDVQIYHGGVAKDPTQIRALTNADVVSAEVTKWIGSTAPTVGQKASASSLPVVIASDQSTVSTTNASVSGTNAAVPASATQIGGSDGTNLQTPRVFDADTGAGTQYVLGAILRKSASGGSVEAGTSSDPLRIDPTGTTAQPVTDNGGSLTIDTTQLPAALVGGRLDINVGAWLGSTAPTVGQKTSANSLPVVIASDQSAVPVSGTVTANQGTAAALAGKWPVQVTDGTNTMPTGDAVGRAIFHKITDGTNTAAVKAASTAAVAADPALVVAISPNTAPIVQTVGTHANLWNNAATGANGNSSVVDCQYTAFITIFGTSSANTSMSVQVSQDNTNFYTISTFTTGTGDFGTNLTIGARYIRLQSASNRTVTATLAGKA